MISLPCLVNGHQGKDPQYIKIDGTYNWVSKCIHCNLPIIWIYNDLNRIGYYTTRESGYEIMEV